MSNYVLIGGFVLNAFRELFFHIDKFVYMIARGAYQVFCYISEITLEREDIVTDLTSRVYAILGILLVFIVTYNLLTYIINPDKISDNKVGASAVIKDIVIALAIIALTPTLFAKLYAFQNTIITSGVISNLILGGYSSSDVEKYGGGNKQDVGRNYIRMGANNMAANVFTAFFTPANNDFSAIYCNKSSTDVSSDSEIQQKNEEYSEYCVAYANMVNTGSMDSFGDLITKNKYEYWFIFSTIGGIILTLFMLSFCLNLAKRVFKLFILQFIAPVPVVMELIPSKKGARKRWFDNLVQVYLEVFFFQAVIFIVIYLISMVPELVIQLFGNKTLSNDTGGWFVKALTLVFLIIGLLQFGKEAPQMIFDLLGIKSTGTISAMAKRALKLPGIGASAVGTGVTSGARGIGSMVNNIRGASNAREYGSAIAGGLANTAIGFLGGLGYGGYANRSGRIRNINRTVGSASNRVQNTSTRISRPVGALGGQIGRGIRNVPNIPGVLQNGSGTVRNVIAHPVNSAKTAAGAAGRGIKSGVGAGWDALSGWATGGNKINSSDYESILERLSKATSPAKIKKNEDARYVEYSKRYNDLRTSPGFLRDFEAYKELYGNADSKEEDYLSWMEFNPEGTMDKNAHIDILDAYKKMVDRETDLPVENESKLKLAAREALAILDNNSRLSSQTDASGNLLFDRDSIARNIDIDSRTGAVTITNRDALQDAIDSFNKNIKSEKERIQAEEAERRYRQEQRGNGNSSSN